MSVAKQGVQGVPRMGHPQGYRSLVAWRVLDELADLVHAATAHFPPGERKLVEQMNSAATSLVANIAEGYGRRSLNEYLHFLGISRGSLAELGEHIWRAKQRRLISEAEYRALDSAQGRGSYLLDRLITALEKKRQQEIAQKRQPTHLKEAESPYLTDDEWQAPWANMIVQGLLGPEDIS
jgi:four helix bundle protein